jgi:hypothetical protein
MSRLDHRIINLILWYLHDDCEEAIKSRNRIVSFQPLPKDLFFWPRDDNSIAAILCAAEECRDYIDETRRLICILGELKSQKLKSHQRIYRK